MARKHGDVPIHLNIGAMTQGEVPYWFVWTKKNWLILFICTIWSEYKSLQILYTCLGSVFVVYRLFLLIKLKHIELFLIFWIMWHYNMYIMSFQKSHGNKWAYAMNLLLHLVAWLAGACHMISTKRKFLTLNLSKRYAKTIEYTWNQRRLWLEAGLSLC